MKGRAKGGTEVEFGEYGLQAMEPCWMTSQQLEAVRVTVSRKLKKAGRFFLRVFPHKPVTKKPAETRMGKGKGNPELWVAVVKPGHMICEIGGLDEVAMRDAFRQAAYKLPIKTRVVKKTSDDTNGIL